MRMMGALNSMMLDMSAAIVCKDYEGRRRRTAQGIAQAKERDKPSIRRRAPTKAAQRTVSVTPRSWRC